jgi:hypothetical protein
VQGKNHIIGAAEMAMCLESLIQFPNLGKTGHENKDGGRERAVFGLLDTHRFQQADN